MGLITGHVVVVGIVAICATIVDLKHGLAPGDTANLYIACIASFTGHGITATLKNGRKLPNGG